jgi:ABC-2 type transport system ATP-binding protein
LDMSPSIRRCQPECVIADIDYLRPFYSLWDRSLEAEVLAHLCLPLERMIKDLSHGMRPKMALACALPFRPRLLVWDEPFSGLDPLVRDEFMDGLLRHTCEMTVLISSHELAEIEHVTTHLAFLDKGRVLFEEPMDDLKARLRRVRLALDGRPQIKELPREWLDVRIEGNIVCTDRTLHPLSDCPASTRRLGTAEQGERV